MESKLFDTTPECVTPEWYAERESAPHLEQEPHRARMFMARDMVQRARDNYGVRSVVDLGCGDGGMLSLLRDIPITAWGYDLQQSNIQVAINQRHVDARFGNFLEDDIEYGDLAICTEVIEHLEDPHGFLARLPSRFLVASSPNDETAEYHYEFHLWAWDHEGYRAMIEGAGYTVLEEHDLCPFQVYLAERRG